jgi:hypothetical protein
MTAFDTFQDAAKAAGHDPETVRELLWAINAHPDLVAHARVFKHVAAHFESVLHQDDLTAWLGERIKHRLPAWLAICRWAWEERSTLAAMAELTAFDRQPKKPSKEQSAPRQRLDHPLLGIGISEHPLVGMLWSSHQSTESYPLRDEESHPAAQSHFWLQTHVLMAEITSRCANLSMVVESGSPQPDPAGRITSSAAVGVALRDFTFNQYSPLLIQIEAVRSTPEFAAAIQNFVPSPINLSPDLQDKADRYLADIKRYFRAFNRHFNRKPIRRRKHSRISRGDRKWRTGFIHYPNAPGVILPTPAPPPEDEDIPYAADVEVLIDSDPDSEGDPHADERSGLAPDESREPAFRLYEPDKIGGQLARHRYQQLAVEAGAQHLPFAWTRLTSQELRHVAELLEATVTRMFDSRPADSSTLPAGR